MWGVALIVGILAGGPAVAGGDRAAPPCPPAALVQVVSASAGGVAPSLQLRSTRYRVVPFLSGSSSSVEDGGDRAWPDATPRGVAGAFPQWASPHREALEVVPEEASVSPLLCGLTRASQVDREPAFRPG